MARSTTRRAVREMKSYLELVEDEVRKRFNKGMNARDAAFDIPFSRLCGPGSASSSVTNLFAEFNGAHVEPGVVKLFEQMANFRDQRRAEGCGHRRHAHGHLAGSQCRRQFTERQVPALPP